MTINSLWNATDTRRDVMKRQPEIHNVSLCYPAKQPVLAKSRTR